MKRIRLFLLIGLLWMGTLMIQPSTPISADDPPNACQLCIEECQAAFPNDAAKRRRCMLSCECNPIAP